MLEKQTSVNETILAVERFKKRRRLCQWFFATGITALVIHFLALGDKFQFTAATIREIVFRIIAVIGLVLLASGTVFLILVNKCPVCTKAFSASKKYDEGAPIFNRIEECPFCNVSLEG